MKDAENWRCARAPPSPPLERVLLYYSKGVQCFLSSAGVIRPVLSSNRLDDEEIVLKFTAAIQFPPRSGEIILSFSLSNKVREGREIGKSEFSRRIENFEIQLVAIS